MRIPRTNLGEAALLLVASLIPLSYQADSHIARADDPCSTAAAAFTKAHGSSIPANIAYECLKAIPLHKDDALHTVQQLRLFLQFYSAQTYFANPPTPELELTPVDLNKTLDDIEANIKSGAYTNNYAYDKAVHNLFGYYRDGHVVYDSACFMPFIFHHQYSLVSVAKTTQDIPEIHVLDIVNGGYSVGERIIEINGLKPSDYLATMANTHPELIWVDPDARYNQLLVGKMNGGVLKGVFASRSTYDDDQDDDITLTWENGTTTEIEWSAQLRSEIAADALDSVDTFYQKICLRSNDTIAGIYTDFNNPGLSETSNQPTPTKSSRIKKRKDLPFLASDEVQPVRRAESSVTSQAVYGMESGELELYTLTEDIGVLVISAFISLDDRSDTGFIQLFSQKVAGAISYLRKKNYTKIIIDVSGNGGGYIRLGRDAVRQLFPGEATFFASNMRWNPALATMLLEGTGTNATYWDLDQYRRASDDSAFTNYAEFLGPVERDGDSFTVIAVDDSVEVEKEDSEPLPASYSGPQPFARGDIILLSSGMCGSTCAVFAEALENRGVHTVTFGGRPIVGPMQTVGGIKGSQVLSFDEIAGWAWKLLGDRVSDFKFIPEVFRFNTFDSASINLRNSWRKVDQDLPIEFLYTPSEYRVMYTADMIVNVTATWETAAQVVWGYEDDFLTANGAGGRVRWKSLGQLIWSKMNGHNL